jgi:uncharacterized protein with NRDE domain
MCLIALSWRTHPRYRLALIANRDEFHGRPAAAAAPDPEFPDVHGGRDLQQGGSWLLASTRGRLAAVTNVRAGPDPEQRPLSRGALVRGFATGTDAPQGYLQALEGDAPRYGRFNLLAWQGDTLRFCSNHPRFTHLDVAPGVHAMSNGAFDAPWPKSTHATGALTRWLDAQTPERVLGEQDLAALEPLFEALADTTTAPYEALPDTGVGLVLERALSPPFIAGERYGTRCSTVVLVEDDAIVFAERRFGPNARPGGTTLRRLPLRTGS